MLCVLKGINYIKPHIYFSKFWAGNKRAYSRHIKNKDNKADKRVLWSVISFLLGIYVYVSFRDILHQYKKLHLTLSMPHERSPQVNLLYGVKVWKASIWQYRFKILLFEKFPLELFFKDRYLWQMCAHKYFDPENADSVQKQSSLKQNTSINLYLHLHLNRNKFWFCHTSITIKMHCGTECLVSWSSKSLLVWSSLEKMYHLKCYKRLWGILQANSSIILWYGSV